MDRDQHFWDTIQRIQDMPETKFEMPGFFATPFIFIICPAKILNQNKIINIIIYKNHSAFVSLYPPTCLEILKGLLSPFFLPLQIMTYITIYNFIFRVMTNYMNTSHVFKQYVIYSCHIQIALYPTLPKNVDLNWITSSVLRIKIFMHEEKTVHGLVDGNKFFSKPI